MPKNFTNRQIEILYELINIDIEEDYKFITNEKLADKIGVSKRTIRRELKTLEKHFTKKEDIRLVKKRGKGTRLLLNQKQKFQLIDIYHKRQKKSMYIDPEKRKNKIIYYLLKNNEITDIGILEKELNISSSTLNRDLKEVEEFLNKYGLALNKEKQSRKIYGNEFKKRILTVNIIQEILPEEKQRKILYKLKKKEPLKLENYNLLEELNILNKLNTISTQIFSIQNEYDISFTTNSFFFLLIYLAFSIDRISENNIENLESLSIFDQKTEFPKSFNLFIAKLNDKYTDLYNGKEKIALFIIFLALTNFKEDYHKISFLDDEITNKVILTSKKIMNHYRENLSVNIEFNSQLKYIKLENYLIDIILNDKFNLNINFFSMKSHELKKIKENNPYNFYLAESLQTMIENNLNLKIKNRDLQYLGILFMELIESKIQTLNAVIIHDNNSILSNLIKNRLKIAFNNMIFTSENYFSVSTSSLEKYDLVISTKYFADLESSIIVSPLINKADRKKIEEKIKVISDIKKFIK